MPNSAEVSTESRKFTVFTGDTVQTAVTVRNSGNAAAQYTFRIEGLDSGWYNLPVSSTSLFPNDEEKIVFALHPPRMEGIEPGLYPFRFIIDCQDNPEDSEQVELVLEVKNIPELELSITPESISGKSGTYSVTASNPGDDTMAVRLLVIDRDPLIRCKLEPADLIIPPNGSTGAMLKVNLRWQYLFHREKTYHFSIATRQPDSEQIKTVSGQLSRTPGKVHYPFKKLQISREGQRKQPPIIHGFEASTNDKRAYRLAWSIDNAADVDINGEKAGLEGEKEIIPAEATSFILTATNKYGSISRTVDVEPAPVPQEKYSDRILALITPSTMQVIAGAEPVAATVEVQNTGSIVDKFFLEIEGLAPSWYSFSVPLVALMPHAKEQAQIFFHPPKIKGVTSGNYSFVVTLRSQSIPEDSTSVTAQLEVLPSVNCGISIKPYRILCRRKCCLQVQITNKDVTEAGLFIDVTDVENGLRFKLENESPAVPPWQIMEIPMLVRPKRNSVIGDLKRYDISLTATTSDGYTQLARAQIDHKPMLSSWRPIFRTIKYVAIFGIAGFAVYYLIRMGGGWSSLVRDPQTWLDGTIRHFRGLFY